jgi:hypothetical protein
MRRSIVTFASATIGLMWTQRLFELAKRHGLDLDDLFELFTERAAIREHSGGMAREDAEVAAYSDVERTIDQLRRGPPSSRPVAIDKAAAGDETRLALRVHPMSQRRSMLALDMSHDHIAIGW